MFVFVVRTRTNHMFSRQISAYEHLATIRDLSLGTLLTLIFHISLSVVKTAMTM